MGEDIEEVLFGRDEDEFDAPITKQKVMCVFRTSYRETMHRPAQGDYLFSLSIEREREREEVNLPKHCHCDSIDVATVQA